GAELRVVGVVEAGAAAGEAAGGVGPVVVAGRRHGEVFEVDDLTAGDRGGEGENEDADNIQAHGCILVRGNEQFSPLPQRRERGGRRVRTPRRPARRRRGCRGPPGSAIPASRAGTGPTRRRTPPARRRGGRSAG